MRRILERSHLFSVVHTTTCLAILQTKLQLNYTSHLQSSLFQFQKSPIPGPHDHQVTQTGCHLYRNLIGLPQTSSGGDTEYHDPFVRLVARQRSSTLQIHKSVMPFKQPGWCSFPTSRCSLVFFVQDILVLSLIHHHKESRRYTTEEHHLIGGAALGSKIHDPFHLRGLNTRHLLERCSSSFTLAQKSPGSVGPQPPCLLCHVPKVLRSLLPI